MKKLLMLLLLSLMLVATSCDRNEHKVSISEDFTIEYFDDGNCANGICPPPEEY